ncbi:unnamed protein product [Staurois parvus]|uniref:Uncharacterized protein n=1 Tax=Staurois parvus TaxID=386267 RepID=A0ABN9BGG8_9NEOB|nr:unnamed protein product [Staurois parvus]
MKAEDDCKLERKQTMKLKNAIEKRPSRDVIYELQRENELLRAKIQELDKPLQNLPKEETSEKIRLYIQDLEGERRQALEQYQEMVNTVCTLKMSLRQAEDLRDKYLEEKEVSELQCTALKKDSKMYKDRIEAILQQMDEVCIERNMAIATREEFHTQYTKGLKDKDALRKQLRELGEKYDDLQIQLIRSEGKLLSLETKLKRTESPALSSDADECSSRSSLEITTLISVPENKTQHDKDQPRPLENGSDHGETPKTEENEHSPVNGEPLFKARRKIRSFEDNRRIRALKFKNSPKNEECYTSESETDVTP